MLDHHRTVSRLENVIIFVDLSKPDPGECAHYPVSMFTPIELPEVAKRALMAAGD